ncbi:MAG: hypothetical protein GX596_14650 [Propionibacterium sp.]|nr:hypothetical protein [Propionibacterium sp.]
MAIETGDADTAWTGPVGAPLVILLHDYMGRLPYLAHYGIRLAGEGYRVALPDFHGGRSTTSPDHALMMLYERYRDTPGALAIIDDAVRKARAEGSPKVGLVGFSMGVSLALEYAATHDGVAGIVAHYGKPLREDTVVDVPVLFQQGADDEEDGIRPAERFRLAMAARGNLEIEVFDFDALHGFANQQREDRFDLTAAGVAWERTLGFLQRTVR